MNKTFQLFLRKTFDIREGEFERAFLMQLNIFLIISTLLVVKPTVNALFLSKFGVENLPYAFILVAIVAAVVSSIYSKILVKIPLHKIVVSTLYFSVFSLIFFGFFLRFNLFESGILYLFYIWVAIFALLSTSQFWVLANIVFNAREAKRLFSFIGAGAIFGGIFGGYMTSVLAQFMSSENLPFVCAVLLACCIPVNRMIWKKYVLVGQNHFQQKKKVTKVGSHPARLVMQSPHLLYLALIVGVSVMVAKLVDYQFGGVAAALIPDPDELTAFFGFWFSTFNVISLLMQLFITRRVVGTFGVGSSLFFLPGSILIAVILLLLFPELLMAAVFLKMADGGLKQSVNKAAIELLILPIPVDIKNQTKTFIDVFVDSLATGISGLILIFLVRGLDLSTNSISLMILFLLLIWFYLATKMKKEYLRSFRSKIENQKDKNDKNPLDLSKESVLNGLKKILNEGNEKQMLFVLNKLNGTVHKKLYPSIRNLLNHPSEAVKIAAIHNLYFFKKNPVLKEIEPFTKVPSQRLKIAAFEYLIARTTENRVAILDTYLKDTDYTVHGAALVSLAKETKDNLKLRSLFDMENRIQKLLDKLVSIDNFDERNFHTITAIKTIGYANIPRFFPVLQPFFHHENLDIAKNAITAAGNTLSPQFINPLVDLLPIPSLKETSRKALAHYGNSIVSILNKMIENGETTLPITRIIPSIVKRIGTQAAVNFLFSLFDYDDLMVRREALRGLNFLRNNHPHLKFNKKNILHRVLEEAKLYQETLSILYTQTTIDNQTDAPQEEAETTEARKGLINLLEKRLDINLERIFRLLGLNYPNGDIFVIYKGIRSQKPDIRTNALEFLDNLIEPSLKNTLIPIVETSMLETITEDAIKALNLNVKEEFQCFQSLLNGKDVRIKLAVLYLLEQLRDKRFLPLLEEQKRSEDKRVRLFAERSINKL